MIYSILPVNFNDYQNSSLEIKNMMYNGTLVEYYEDLKGNKVVNRVLSTSLKSYLNTEYFPGTIIRE